MARIARTLLVVTSLSAISACSSVNGDAPSAASTPDQDGPVASVTAAIASVPAGVQCLQFNVGSFTKSVTVAAGGNTVSVSLGTLPAGYQQAQALAYNAACGTSPMPGPTWQSTSTYVLIASAGATTLNFEMIAVTPSTATVDFVNAPVAIAAGLDTTLATMNDGSLRCWGACNGIVLTPTSLAGFPAVASGASSNGVSCAEFGGKLGCWGNNTSGQLGTGVPTSTFSSMPVFPTSASGQPFTSVAVGPNQVCGLASSSPLSVDVECWGNNSNGAVNGVAGAVQLRPISVSIPSAFEPIAIATGGISCAIDASYVGWCWGQNNYGSFGTGAAGAFAGPTQIFGRMHVSQLAVGAVSTCALKIDETVWCAGDTSFGQLGDGSTASYWFPVQVTGLSGVTQLTASSVGTFYALTSSGTVFAWGFNQDGELGNQTTTNSTTPVQVSGLTGITSVSAGYNHACALKSDGTTWCWGNNQAGQVGDGTVTSRYTPVRVAL